MSTAITVFCIVLVVILLFFIFTFCAYLTDKIKELKRLQMIVRHQNEAMYEILLKLLP